MNWIETFLDAFRAQWYLFLSLSFSSNRSICSPCGFLPLRSHRACKRGQGWRSFNLANGGWGNQGRCNSFLVYCSTAEWNCTPWVLPWMQVGEDRRALGKMGGWACSIRKPWVSAGTAWCLAAGLWGTPHTKPSCLGSERNLGQALNSLEVNNWRGSSPRGLLMPFACFRCGQK